MVVWKLSLPSLNLPVASVPLIVTLPILPAIASFCISVRLIAVSWPGFILVTTYRQPTRRQPTVRTQIKRCLMVEFNPLPRFLLRRPLRFLIAEEQSPALPLTHSTVRRQDWLEGASTCRSGSAAGSAYAFPILLLGRPFPTSFSRVLLCNERRTVHPQLNLSGGAFCPQAGG